MKIRHFNIIFKKAFSKKLIILYIIFTVIMIFIWGPVMKRFLYFEAAQIRDYIHKEFFEINALIDNKIQPDTISINLPKEVASNIHKTRRNVLNTYFKDGDMNIKKHSYHKGAIIQYKNYIANSNIKLFGMNSDHYQKNKTSFRVKFKGGDFFAKKKVNFLSPKTRSFQMDFLCNAVYKNAFGGIGIQQVPIILSVNNVSKGIYFMEDFFDKYLIEKNKKKDSFIFESGYNSKFQGSEPISKLNTEEAYFNINTIPKGKKWENLSKRIISLFHNNDPNELFHIIDSEKLNAVIGLCLFSQDNHPLIDINLHWYYNPVNNRLEPLIREAYIKQIPSNYSINKIWDEFYMKIKKDPALKLINDWITYHDEQKAKNMIIKSALKSALYIKKYIDTQDYKKFTSKLNAEFSYNVSQQEMILKHNTTQMISKVRFVDSVPLINDSIILITNNMKLEKDLVIEKNMKLKINAGVNIILSNNSNIYLYGEIVALGNSSNPIRFIGDTNSNSAIYINSIYKNQFNYCEFMTLSELNNNLKTPLFKDFWQTSSAITIYESVDISFYKCRFINNQKGDDMINAVCSDNIKFSACSFKNILSDALDADFSNLEINQCRFSLIGNDAVDGSNSNIQINNSEFEKIADKAISAGEESHINILNCEIKDSELALVVKDGSLLEIENVFLENNSLDLIAFSKKEEYSAPKFRLRNCTISNYLIDKKTTNLGIGNYYRTSQSIQDVLYGIQYGRASDK